MYKKNSFKYICFSTIIFSNSITFSSKLENNVLRDVFQGIGLILTNKPFKFTGKLM